ncbi:hypothetical protein F8S13_03405 [Chloroflexia bacterium SDU3-3]|nr:hypothetical protein F8S13_03405 [Chloroflexia bacterium SDU3-3]
MRSAWLFLLPVAALLGSCGVADTAASTPASATAAAYADAATAQAVSIDTGLAFIPNQGLDAGDALFSAQAFGGVVQFAPSGY